MHQRKDDRDRRALRRRRCADRRADPGRATRGRRLELRDRERLRPFVVRHDDQCPRRPARVRARDRRIGRTRAARRGGEEYLLERGLFRRKSTGEVAVPTYLEFSFPYYWHYDVLRALDYFRGSGADPDPRMAEAVEVVRSKQQPDGRWLLDRIHPGDVHFALEDGVGTPSRWNTLRALRILEWWDGTAQPPDLARSQAFPTGSSRSSTT